MRHIHLSILGLALGLASGLRANAGPCVTINSLNFNSGYVIQLVNNPQSVNPNAALNILTAQITNSSGNVIPAGYAVTLTLTEPANPDGCGGAIILSPISLTLKNPVPMGASVLRATDFNGSGQATICQLFQDDINNQFKSINPDNANAAITQFLRRRFQVTLADGCSQASTFITIFNQSAGANASPARLLMPRDQSVVTDSLPLFLWAPAVAPGTTQGIDYTLVLSQSNGGAPLPNGGTIAHLPTGQLVYKWQSSDAQLPAGKIYWTVVARDHASQGVLGGPGAWDSFNYQPTGQAGASNCGYTLADLGQYAQRAAGDKAGLLQGLTLQRVQLKDADGVPLAGSGLNDADVCALLGQAGGSAPGKVHLLNLTVTRR